MDMARNNQVARILRVIHASFVSEGRWHETQTVVRIPEGDTLKMHLKINDELARWVIGLGPSAKVVTPPSLRDPVLNMLNESIGNYKKAA